MNKLTTLLIALLISVGAGAQTAASYLFTRTTGTYSSISSTGTLYSSVDCDDCADGTIPLGFSFVFCGTTYTSLSVCSNGWLSLAGETDPYYYPAYASNIGGPGWLFPIWNDGYGGYGGSNCYYTTTGTAGSRVFTFEYYNWDRWAYSSADMNVQVKLYEGSNAIEYCYGTNNYTNTDFGIGIANSTSDYQNLPNASSSTCVSSLPCCSGSCGLPSNGAILHWQLCNPAVSGGTTAFCSGSTTTITGTPTGGTWSSSATSVATVNSSGVVTGVSGGTARISYLAPCGTYATQVVTVNAAPAAITSSTSCVIVGQTISLTDATSGGTWGTSNPGLATVSSSGVVTGTGAGVVTITYTLPSSCFVTKSVTVSALDAISGSDNVCLGATTTFTNSASGGAWTSSNSSTASVGAGTGIVTGAGVGNATITYTVPAGCFVSKGITVNALPTAISGGTSPLCPATSTTLSSTPSGGTWSSSNTSLATVDASSGVVTGVAGGNPVITYTTAAGCTATKTLTVNTLSPISGSSSMCSGNTLTLSNSTSGGVWSSSNTSVATVNSSGLVSSVSTGTTTISYYVASIGCAATHVVGVTSSPTAYALAGGGSYCSGGTGVVISLSGSDAGASYQLYSGAIPMGSPVIGTGSPISFGLQTTGGTYMAIANPGAGAGCQLDMSGTATVVVNPLPIAYSVTGGGAYCAGGSGANICMSYGTTGIQYTLYNGAAPVGVVGGTNAAFCFGPQSAVGTYSVVAENTATGCMQTMSGMPSVSTAPAPTAQTVTGGGSYCAGGTGIAVGLGATQFGVSYQLYNSTTGSIVGSSVAGTGLGISFGSQTTAGVYTVMATQTTGTVSCTTSMTGSATVIQNANPPVFTVSGGGNYCSGGTGLSVTLAGSTAGINYQLYNGTSTVGTAVAGTGSALTYGPFTATGTYTVKATNPITGCTADMTGSAVIGTNSLPNVYTVGGGGSYCIGGSGYAITLSGSQTGVNYTCYRGGSTVVGMLPGTGGSLSFGTQTEAGTYTIVAVNATTGCTATQSGSATITVNALPIVYPVTGGGNYCSGGTGVAIGLGGSESGVNYRLYNGATAIGSTVAGTGSPITFGVQTLSGTFTVFAINASTSCPNNMSGTTTIGINPLPSSYAVTGGGSYCNGASGVAIGLGSSQAGVNYSLYNGASVVAVVSGTGSAISFGMYTAAATYTVGATNATTSCVNSMTGSATVSINALPNAQTITSSGSSYCAGGSGITLGLGGSQSGVAYQLYRGSTAVGLAVSGTGSPISFGDQTTAGTYSVIATNSTTACARNMTGTANVGVNALPVTYGITGGGNYCSGGTGVALGLSGSESGVNYQLYNGLAAVGASVSGTGSAISFGSYTASGTYSIVATNSSTGCMKNMSGTANVSINTLPVAQTITGGGVYCQGTSGSAIGLANSVSGVNYQLYNGSTAVGSAVPGTGSAVSFGTQTAIGTYIVKATNTTTGCMNTMSGSATVSMNAAPVVYTVTGGGNYCAGGDGVHIGVSGSNAGINYQLYNGSLAVGSPVAGTGAALDFGTYTTSGTYYVGATNGTTSCASTMGGSAIVGINNLPTAYTVTGGGSYCNGGTGVSIGLAGSDASVSYQLYVGSVPSGTPLSGTGLALDFGLKTASGTYTIVGYNAATGCMNTMNSSAIVVANALPVVQTVTGGGNYCSGSTGVVIGLENSVPGTSYQLYNGSALAGTAVFGTGDPIEFGTFATAGTYSVLATNIGSSCSRAMSGTAVVGISPLPSVYTTTGGGTICAGSTGTNVYLNNSTTGVSYQLYANGIATGAPVSGTGSAISFGPQTTAGVYTVQATNSSTGCVRNMNGTATINVNSQPAAQIVTGGGNYCSGDAGVAIGLGSSASGVSYQLYNGASTVGAPISGTGGPISFGLQTATGNYSVTGTNNTTGCMRSMTGTVAVGINNLPTAYTVSGGGNLCAGGLGTLITLSSSNNGITYQLYNGSTATGTSQSGTGGPLVFGPVSNAGTYYVVASNNLTGCTRYMSGSAVVNVNALPVAYAVTGGGSYCSGDAGIAVGLSSSMSGISYQLYRGGAVSGSAVAGNGGEISFGLQTASGSYSVLATNNTTGCTNAMGGSVTVSVNNLPVAQTVSGGGSYCNGGDGVHVTLGNSEGGVQYQLMNGSTSVGAALSGTGSSLDFGLQTGGGTYTVSAMDATTGCVRTMNGSATIVVNSLPAAQTVTGGGSYCNGGDGVAIGLSGSASGITYQLNDGTADVGSAVAGTGTAISFGLQTAGGTYTVKATNNTTGCMSTMTGSATVTVKSLPGSYAVLSTGSSFCAGSEGAHIQLSGSDATATYQLYNNGIAVGTSVSGTGALIDFGAQGTAGIYTIVGMSSNGCSRTMSGSAPLIVNALPTAYSVTGGGGYCNGDAGTEIGLSGSSTGISYQLYSSTGMVGTSVNGTGAAISFGNQPSGTYHVIATNVATTCTNMMTGTVLSTLNAAPTVYAVGGGGSYCNGGTGSEITLSGSTAGTTYQLYNGSGAVGTAVSGTGSGISLGMQTGAGTYTVKAVNGTTGCSAMMSGSAVVSINSLPGTQTITGGGSYCSGGAGVHIGLASTVTGVNYQLYKGGLAVGSLVAGTGSSIDFGAQTAGGSYAVIATSTDNGCTNVMSGSAVVVVSALPTVYSVTGGGNYCATSTATGLSVGLSGSESGVSYQLYKDGTASGTAMSGSGSALDFGMHLAGGDYTVIAQNSDGCSADMAGAATIVVNPAVTPAVSVSTGVGNTVCLGVLTTFTASAVNGGTSPGYQWKVNGTNVGMGYSSYAYVPANGDVVSVEMTSSAACASPMAATGSVTMEVSSHQMPNVNVTANPGNVVCSGTAVTLTSAPSYGGNAPVIKWYRNGSLVGAGTSYSYTPSNGDEIKCELTSNYACRLSDVVDSTITMEVQSATAPVVSISANPGVNVAQGQLVTLTATASGAYNATYQWSVNGVSITGATGSVYASNSFANNDAVSCEVTSHGACLPMSGSKTVVLKVGTVGVNGVVSASSDLRLLPNPNKGDFMVKGTLGVNEDRTLSVEITDMLGQSVYRGEVEAKSGVVDARIRLSSVLANGMYMLNLRSGSDSKVFHFVLQQ